MFPLSRLLIAGLAVFSFIGSSACATLGARATAPDELGLVDVMSDFGEAPAGPSVRVHIESRYEVSIVRLSDDNDVVERCTAPCDKDLALSGRYRLDGNDVRSSWPFTLTGAPGEHIVLRVSPSLRASYTRAKTVGTASLIVSGVGLALALGGGFAGLSASGDDSSGRATSCQACEGVSVVGAALMVVGIGIGTYSLVGQISNMSSSVDQRAPALAAAPDTRPVALWRSSTSGEPPLPRPMQLTVLEGRF